MSHHPNPTLATLPARKRRLHATPLAAVGLSALLLTACAAPGGSAGSATDASPSSASKPSPKEAGAPTPRLVYTHDGGIGVLDAASLADVGGAELAGFNRLNPAGDGRHVFVSTGDAFRLFDAGAWSEPHGDHSHHYVSEPALTDFAFEADKAGHVVLHAGKTVLFSDGSGKVESFESSALGAAVEDGKLPVTDVYTTPEAHHGVAVELEDGKLLVTLGNEESRSGIAVLSAGKGQDRQEIVRNEDCPGVHGEAVAAREAVVVGCENGMLIYKDGAITKVASPDAYGRLGNQAGSEKSPVILGDYKVDKAAKPERPTRISLVNTETAALQLVDIGTSYSFRSLGRGPAGEALVLGTDGGLRVIDPLTGAVTATIPVVAPWEESATWQDPRPTLFVQGSTAYVTEPASQSLHAVDLKAGKVSKSAKLEHTANELTGVTG
ncbi:zinc metallochaperone AztD [Paenarthrobacter sp. JL.01a]|uniref:zinc metallochaperone AztD n=1 Tax=Paenarthrobacter sp. JL.01a TaxID=2979324 RepID=UPI0021CA42AD|nr:zinc metallochaperone AztD [Paenarthrobacter sp. JL.01a]UXM91669.1 zinc metallochaperone AztD [Paenarthrobacter sp. JL.01a]